MSTLLSESFWQFFFMIGFVGSINWLREHAPTYLRRHLHWSVSPDLLAALFLLATLAMIEVLASLRAIAPLTASMLRNAALLFVSTRMVAHRLNALMVLGEFALVWPLRLWALDKTTAFILLLVALIVMNYNNQWVNQSFKHYALTVVVMSVLQWGFAMLVNGYAARQMLLVVPMFVLLLLLADAYDRQLLHDRQQTQALTYGNNHDELTGARSRSLFRRDFARFQESHTTAPEPLQLAMADIDHFKAINDTYGHLAGDEALINFARQFDAYFIPKPYYAGVYRTGGEEFSVLMDAITPDQARQELQGFVTYLRTISVLREDPELRLTISIGIADSHPRESLHDLIARADAKLYQAKRNGRNTICD